MQVQTVTTWTDYRWGLNFDSDFFRLQERERQQRTQRRGRQSSAEEDPFQEIRIRQPGQERTAGTTRTESLDEVLIQGASVRRGSSFGMSEGEIMGRILGGGWSRRGGLRGARIAGARANRLQGSVTTGLSTSALDARPFALDGRETPDPGYLNWEAGLSVGVPLGKSGSSGASFFGRSRRPFLFVDFNTSWGDQLHSQYASVPTALERGGDFSQTTYPAGPLAGQPVRIFDPLGGGAFPGDSLPSDRLNPAALGLLAFVPLPNRADPFLNFFQQESLNNTRNRLNGRLSVPVSDSLRLGGSYQLRRGDSQSFHVFPGLGGHRNSRGQNASLSLNHTLSSGLIHSTRIRWNRNRSRNLNAFAFARDVASDLGIENTSAAPIDWGLPGLEFTNYTNLRDGSSSLSVREENNLSDFLQLAWGGHMVLLGGEIGWNRHNLIANPEGSGTQTFAGIATSAYSNGRPIAGTGYDLADFLLGLAQSSRIQYGNSDHYLRARKFSFYVNDNWRIHSRLTLQWGLRYQYVSPWLERYDRLANLDVAEGFTAVRTVTPGDPGSAFGAFPRALVQSDRNNVAPRLGLAYRLRSGQLASVLRASYGVFHRSDSYDAFGRELISQPPFGFAVQETVQGRNFLPLESAFDSQLAEAVPNTYAVDPHFRLATVQTWNLSLQQALPRNFFLSVGYTGSRGTGLELLRAPNRVREGVSRIPGVAQFLYLTPGASSSMHGLQVLALRRVRSGFSVNGRYQFGKSLDNAASLSGAGRVVAQNDDALDSEWGRSNLDQTHKVRLGWFWELPFGDRHRWLREAGVLRTALNNWFVTGSLRAESGNPLTAFILGNQINNSGSASQASERANATGQPVNLPSSEQSSQRWFNTDAFTLPPAGAFGNAGRNTIASPGFWDVQLQLARSVPMGEEGRRLLVLIDASNLLNHVNYTSLNTIVNSRGFGQVTAAGGMRRVQVSFRFMF